MTRRQNLTWASTLVACAFVVAASVAIAQPPKPGERKPNRGRPGGGERPSVEQIIHRFDTDGDGKLSKAELPEQMAERILRADANGDDTVTKEELAESFKRLAAGRRGQGGGRGMPDPEEVIKRLDANGDGKLTKDEMPGRMAERMMRADANGDGGITKEELAEARKRFAGGGRGPGGGRGMPNPEQMFQRLDENGDGKLAKDELPPHFAERLMRADADGDGAVSKSELEEARKKFAGQRGGPGGRGPGDRGGRNPGQMFDRMDRNSDGKLTKDEMPEQIAERLMRADTDGDGAVSKEELEKVRGRKPARDGQRPKRD